MKEYHQNLEKKITSDLWYSFRRYYVDKFHFEHIVVFEKNAQILDMGGKKMNKRGEFDIEKYELNVQYANIDQETQPDYLCDITNIPVGNDTFDGVILSEVLEHVEHPIAVLKEAYRVLKPGGKLMMCTPFQFHVHADPHDFGRYTDFWYHKKLSEIGFKIQKIEKQGLFFSVLGNMLKLWAYEFYKVGRPYKKWKRYLFHKFIFWFVEKAMQWDHNEFTLQNKAFSNNTTGFGILCQK